MNEWWWARDEQPLLCGFNLGPGAARLAPPVEPLEGHGFEATIDGTTITIPGYGTFIGVIGRG